jgi:Uma2 family endonuclease
MALSSLPLDMVSAKWTADMVRALPDDGNRYEVIDGVLLVTPSPGFPHQTVGGQLHGLLWTYLREIGRERTLFYSPADISWNPDTLAQPDLFVVHPRELSGEWKAIQTLLLAIEIVSPSSRRTDYMRKRELYQRYGVREYWIVDPKRGHVEVWHPGDKTPVVVTATLTWRPDPALIPSGHAVPKPLALDLTDLFRDL